MTSKLAELREIFRSFDRNNDGSLTQLELGSLLRSLGLKPSPDQLEALIQKADTNSNGLVEFSEFVGLGWEWVYYSSRVGALYGQAWTRLDGRGAYRDDQGG
ncbi:hypothetical protein F0562_007702 [Nyssa sinensis]|uniref:EF-hand domain-containing protein n=1 Tax=Nyssa sinensis TaxID=561372 RepID=A0A5J5A8X5_9ASTE|nr:hypothetical protein F0562_007702 [Nyssa sinensis]